MSHITCTSLWHRSSHSRLYNSINNYKQDPTCSTCSKHFVRLLNMTKIQVIPELFYNFSIFYKMSIFRSEKKIRLTSHTLNNFSIFFQRSSRSNQVIHVDSDGNDPSQLLRALFLAGEGLCWVGADFNASVPYCLPSHITCTYPL